MKLFVKLAGAVAIAATVGCAALFMQEPTAIYDAAKPHHTPGGFKNNYPHDAPKSFWKWQWERLRDGTPATPPGGWASVLPSEKPDVAFLKANRSERTMTWIGHATVLLQTGGVNIITDPIFSERASPVPFAGPKRQVPLMVSLDELPAIDIVFISHNHYDHLDAGTIREFGNRFPNATYVVPLGLRGWLAEQGITKVRELDWWDRASIGGVDCTLVPVQHWSKRTLSDTNRSLWGGLVVEDRGWRFLHTGDTGYSQDFRDIGARFPQGIDWLAVPIGAYEPRWFMKTQHVNPDEAVRIMRDVGAKQALAIHWGTFILTDEPLDQPPKDLARALAEQGVDPARFHVFRNGEMRRL